MLEGARQTFTEGAVEPGVVGDDQIRGGNELRDCFEIELLSGDHFRRDAG